VPQVAGTPHAAPVPRQMRCRSSTSPRNRSPATCAATPGAGVRQSSNARAQRDNSQNIPNITSNPHNTIPTFMMQSQTKSTSSDRNARAGKSSVRYHHRKRAMRYRHMTRCETAPPSSTHAAPVTAHKSCRSPFGRTPRMLKHKANPTNIAAMPAATAAGHRHHSRTGRGTTRRSVVSPHSGHLAHPSAAIPIRS